MSHHDGMNDAFMKQLAEQFRLGATGQFPKGKLTEADEGELRMAVGIERGNVVIHFGKEVAWIGVSPEEARDLADMLIQKADEAMGKEVI